MSCGYFCTLFMSATTFCISKILTSFGTSLTLKALIDSHFIPDKLSSAPRSEITLSPAVATTLAQQLEPQLETNQGQRNASR
ncbi:hypothetical protein CEXT_353681 [Caerostris extrusa]|uniref:Secreted protein n=1 Tax=Caerostris extrusa TaxID=172846 RepID=A0AAV4QT51_CAEEX|nr:hypothetical protein CEXT_353681 [Caerostris extrusa]